MAKYTPLEEYLKGQNEARRFRFALPILKKLLGGHCQLRHENIVRLVETMTSPALMCKRGRGSMLAITQKMLIWRAKN